MYARPRVIGGCKLQKHPHINYNLELFTTLNYNLELLLNYNLELLTTLNLLNLYLIDINHYLSWYVFQFCGTRFEYWHQGRYPTRFHKPNKKTNDL